MVERLEPPFILDTPDNQFYAFVNPSFEVKFKGNFVKKVPHVYSSNSDIESPSVTLNDTRFEAIADFSDCEDKKFFQHYLVCKTVTLKFVTSKTDIPTSEYPVLVTISDPTPNYSMYFTEIYNSNCQSNFTMVLINLNHQKMFPLTTQPYAVCDNTTKTNEKQSFKVAFNAVDIDTPEGYYPFFKQHIDKYNDDRMLHPYSLTMNKEDLSFSFDRITVLSSSSIGNERKYIIRTGHNNTIGSLYFYNQQQYLVRVPREKQFIYTVFPLDVMDERHVVKSESMLAGGFYTTPLNDISFTVLGQEGSRQFTNIRINSTFVFYVDDLPNIKINDKKCAILKYHNAQSLPMVQYFHQANMIVESDCIDVEIEGILTSSDVKKISIENDRISTCQFTKEF